jgi:hypothetical protein
VDVFGLSILCLRSWHLTLSFVGLSAPKMTEATEDVTKEEEVKDEATPAAPAAEVNTK